jgi:hypothetical protein
MTFSRKQLIYFIAGLAILKVLFLIVFRPAVAFFEDQDIAVNLCKSNEFFIFWDGVKNHTFQFPVYPFLVSLIYRLFGVQPLLVMEFHIIINMLSAILLIDVFAFFMRQFRLPEAAQKHTDKIIFVSVLLFMLHPGITHYALFKIHPFTMDLFMLILPIYFTARYLDDPSRRRLIILFLAFGFAVLTRATLIVAALPFAYFLYEQTGLKKTAAILAALVLTVSLMCAPWLFRNYQQDRIVGFASLTGKELYKGSLPNSEGSNYLDNGKDYTSLRSKSETDSLNKMSVKAQDDYFKKLYYHNMKEQPALQARLYVLKLKNFWLFRSQLGNEYSPRVQKFIPFYLGYYLILLVLAIWASIQIGKRSLILLSIPILLSLMQAVFYVETRHRLIVEPLLSFLAVLGFVFLYLRFIRRKAEDSGETIHVKEL